MTKTIVVCGYGPGISHGVARKFGSQGFHVALVGRRQESLERGVRELEAAGMTAKAFVCDLGKSEQVSAMIRAVRSTLGPITVLHWNAYSSLAGDLTACSAQELDSVFQVGVTGLVIAVQEALADLRQQDGAAVLVTGGGFAFYDENVDGMIVQWSSMGLGIVKAAQHKLAGILGKKLAGDGIFVGEVMVLGAVKGTAFDTGRATLDPADVAETFWKQYTERGPANVQVQG